MKILCFYDSYFLNYSIYYAIFEKKNFSIFHNLKKKLLGNSENDFF